jgi:hypothetical protein
MAERVARLWVEKSDIETPKKENSRIQMSKLSITFFCKIAVAVCFLRNRKLNIQAKMKV